MKRCGKGKSCGASCINRSDRCVLQFGAAVTRSIKEARSKLGAVMLYNKVRDQKIRGGQARFDSIRKKLGAEVGGRIHKEEHLLELKRRLQAEGLLPKTQKSEGLGDIFMKGIEAGKAEKTKKPLPPYLKDIDFLAPRQLERSPGARTRTILPPKNISEAEEVAKAGKRGEPLEGRIAERSPGVKTKTPQKVLEKSPNKPDELYGAWDNSALKRHKDWLEQRKDKHLGAEDHVRRIEKELNRRENNVKEDISQILHGKVETLKSGGDFEAFKTKFLNTDWPSATGGTIAGTTGNIKWAREDAHDHDGDMLRKGISKELGNKSYRWEDSYGSGSTLLGRGAYGTVLREPNKGNAIKRGEVGQIEADLIERLGKVDLGPKLLAAQLDGDSPYNPGTKIGRVAMSVVAGSPIGSKAPDKEIGGVKVSDAYWTARANLHRMGIAHNDMHIDNVLIDRKGKARFVDMGLAQDSPKAALAEAMGAFLPPKGSSAERGRGAAGQGDWQVRRWKGTGGDLLETYEHRLKRGASPGAVELARKDLETKAPLLAKIQQNKADVQFAMLKDGFTKDDIATVMDHGIRSPMETYEQGVWAKLSNEQAQKYISILYDGV